MIWTTLHQRRDMNEKQAQHHQSLGKWKLKACWDTTAYLQNDKIKQNTLTIPRAGHYVQEQLKLSDIAVGHAN